MTPVEQLLREAPSPTVTNTAALSRVAAILRAQKAKAPGEMMKLPLASSKARRRKVAA